MATVYTEYLGDLRTSATHIRSGNTLITDAPVDNNGKGEAFSPTDLVAAALGSCMLTIIGIYARKHHLGLEGMKMEITKIMTQALPRKIEKIVVSLYIPGEELSAHHRSCLEYEAIHCPVALSIHPDIEKEISFNYSVPVIS